MQNASTFCTGLYVTQVAFRKFWETVLFVNWKPVSIVILNELFRALLLQTHFNDWALKRDG